MEKIDTRGKVCPLPLFYTKQKIEKMNIDEEIEIIADDPTVKDTVPRWSQAHGHEVIVIEDIENLDGNKYFRIIVRKKENKRKFE